MSNEYDKIIKENIEAVFLPLAEKYLGISIVSFKKLPGKFQSTIEREPDFIRIVQAKDQNEFILQIEFQTADQKDMIYRMAEYHALLLKKYKYPVKQFVVYLGKSIPWMRTLLREEVMKGFGLINLHALDHEQLLHSQIPEEIILAILGKYDVDVEKLVEAIIQRLKEVSGSEIALQKYIRQLTILSRLRNLEEVVTKKSKEMPITYDIKKDYLYNEGKKEGRKEGRKEGIQKEKQKMIKEMLIGTDLSTVQIAKIASVSESYVDEIKAKLKSK
jgi:predicted transposase/invertase (TIGR01784 family)